MISGRLSARSEATPFTLIPFRRPHNGTVNISTYCLPATVSREQRQVNTATRTRGLHAVVAT
ncbi:hypothetical protein E2C01_079225 [Portunus trituberculatus]|uniref:Uncharacterized protein n=1 Tax=Portunus trituberculatus TaxID=210409 RepID=A0A5B7IS63_PORTR|nr:hypothetical protein [Portunus trituberculatus]